MKFPGRYTSTLQQVAGKIDKVHFLEQVCAQRRILVNAHTTLVTCKSRYSRLSSGKRKQFYPRLIYRQSLTPTSVMTDDLFSNIWLGKSMVLQINYSGAHPESLEQAF